MPWRTPVQQAIRITRVFPKGDKQAIKIPLAYKEVMASPQAKELKSASDKEMDILKEHQVFDKVPIKSKPSAKINHRFSFRVQGKATGLYKSRLVVQAYNLEPGCEYWATFVPV